MTDRPANCLLALFYDSSSTSLSYCFFSRVSLSVAFLNVYSMSIVCCNKRKYVSPSLSRDYVPEPEDINHYSASFFTSAPVASPPTPGLALTEPALCTAGQSAHHADGLRGG